MPGSIVCLWVDCCYPLCVCCQVLLFVCGLKTATTLPLCVCCQVLLFVCGLSYSDCCYNSSFVYVLPGSIVCEANVFRGRQEKAEGAGTTKRSDKHQSSAMETQTLLFWA